MSGLPPFLEDILRQVSVRRCEPTTAAFLDASAARSSETLHLVPGAVLEDGGDTLVLGELSPGCRCCKDGAWDCVFVTGRCNLNCSFCCSPAGVSTDAPESAFGASIDEVLDNYERVSIRGVSFSGGEALLAAPVVLDWLRAVKRRFPKMYCWLYTNGLLAAPPLLAQLRDAGLDEIRFNLAATGYSSPRAMSGLEAAVRLIPVVTVEIPAIPDDAEVLLGSIPAWAAAGVKHLNLHELMREPASNSSCLPGIFEELRLEDGHQTGYHPASRALAASVMMKVQQQSIPLSVNDCSLRNKLRQVRGRRRNIASLIGQPFEKLLGDTFLESVCAFRSPSDFRFVHPDRVLPLQADGYRFVRLVRTCPLAVSDRGVWVSASFVDMAATQSDSH